ncbi:MAG: carbon starvation protein A [Treponema sp.]|jgi:carbon starvation protein|nr:carbon starvation protein A [Treponema sp.]
MNVLFIVLGCGALYVLAYFTYGKFLARKVFKLNDENVTPAKEFEDGQDFVPAKKGFLLGQHFSAIAAAGPVNGPILAAVMFGWGPAILWCLLGAIFIGGIHDMGSLIASVRHKAKSITEVIRLNVTNRAWILFMVFIWITLVYLIVAFADITAGSFVGLWRLEDGSTVKGGGIAASSIMYLILPMIMGCLMRYTKLTEGWATLIFLPLVGVAIVVGQYIPINLPIDNPVIAQKVWAVLILAYCMVAAVVPMWLLLQPRGALGGYFLYAVLLFAAIGLIFGGFKIEYPAFRGFTAPNGSPLFPVLFITIACGACSGFHALVSSGTTCKQLTLESHAKPIGYGGMLLEGMVACVSVACVMIVVAGSDILSRAPNFIYARGIGRFMELIGIPATIGISFGLMAFTTFVYDTLDVCTRLGRYIIEELTGWKDIRGKALGTVLTALVPVFFIFQTMTNPDGSVASAWSIFWGTFGASNQLLAALALIGISIWLKNGVKTPYVWLAAFLPAVFMYCMSMWALFIAVYTGWILGKGHPVIPYVSVVLIILALMVGIETVISMWRNKKPIEQRA